MVETLQNKKLNRLFRLSVKYERFIVFCIYVLKKQIPVANQRELSKRVEPLHSPNFSLEKIKFEYVVGQISLFNYGLILCPL